MKNIFRTRTSLIIACVVLGIVIGSLALSGCGRSYGLIEGMTTTTTTNDKTAPAAAASSAAAPAASVTTGTTSPTPAPAPANTLTTTDSKKKDSPTPAPVDKKDTTTVKDSISTKENFEVRQPIGFASLQTSSSDDWNLSRWVKDAARYAKGMGNENKLDSYQYNSGPPIPLPEGEMFFFKDTKFDSSCCPGTYSNSTGCACLSKPQFNYLTTRGGNHTIPNTKTAYYNEF